MRIGRTLPPASAPITWEDIFNGIKGQARGRIEIDGFIDQLKKHFMSRHCFLLSSGTAALSTLLAALHELDPGKDEVLVPAYTCFTVPAAIVRAGLKVRPCDMDPNKLDYDFRHLGEELNRKSEGGLQEHYPSASESKSRVLAVLSVHLFGLPPDLNRLNSLVPKSVSLVEDAAQAMGGSYQGKLLGTCGRAGVFSLGRGKSVTAINGGILVTDDDRLGRLLNKKISVFPKLAVSKQIQQVAFAFILRILQQPRLFWIPKSLPYLRLGETVFDPGFALSRFTPFQAGLSHLWQSKLKSFQDIRASNAAWWDSNIQSEWVEKLSLTRNGSIPALLRYPLLAKDGRIRERILAMSEDKGLGIMPGYPLPINQIRGLRVADNETKFPGAQDCAERLFTLPVHLWVTAKDRVDILQTLQLNNMS